MSETISTSHKDIEVTYSEFGNRWEFLVNGRELSAASLKDARDKIDEYLRKAEKDKFTPFEAYFEPGFNGRMEIGRVTSIAPAARYGAKKEERLRVSYPGGRETTSPSTLFAVNNSNTELVKQIHGLCDKRDALISEIKELKGKLQPIQFNGDL